VTAVFRKAHGREPTQTRQVLTHTLAHSENGCSCLESPLIRVLTADYQFKLWDVLDILSFSSEQSDLEEEKTLILHPLTTVDDAMKPEKNRFLCSFSAC